MEVFFDLQRFQDIDIGTGIIHSLVSGSSGNDSIHNQGNMITVKAGAGNDTVYNYEAQLARTYLGEGDDSVNNYKSNNGIIYGEAGSDTIWNRYGENVTISGGDGDDSIYSEYSKNVSISGGAGNDTIYNYNYYYSDNPGGLILTISGGKGDDIIQTSGAYYNDIIQYTQGDGNDVIYGFGGGDGGDTLKVTGKSISTMTSGDDVYVFVGDGTIVLRDAAEDFSSSNLVTVKGGSSSGGGDDSGGGSEKNKWRLSGTTAKYGTSSKTLATVKGAKSTSGLGVPSGKKITLKNTALNKKVTVSGSYEFDFASGYKNATISGTAKADSITARGSNIKIIGGKGNDSIKMVGTGQTVSGGSGADVFVYAASGGKEKITDFSSNDKLKIGASGTGNYSTVRSGDDIVVNVDDGGKITLVGALDLSSVNIIGTESVRGGSGKGVKVSSNGKQITLTEDFEDSTFSLTGKYSSARTLNASDALLELNITGNSFANKITGSTQDDTINGGAGADTIRGGEGNDSIFGGKGNDVLIGGDGKDTLWGGTGDDKLYGNNGKDVFYYRTGEGSDTIYGYEASLDKIILGSGSVSNVTTDRNNNVIFSIGDGQIVVNNCVDRTVNIYNSSGKNIVGHYEPQD